MDFSAFELDDVIPFPIVDTSGAPTGIIFSLAGPAHQARVERDRKQAAKALREFNKKGRATLPENPDEIYARDTDRMVDLTLGWSGVTDSKGETLPFSADAVRAVYENRRSSVRAQVARALSDIANFTPPQSPN
jgi:hypothetical protein